MNSDKLTIVSRNDRLQNKVDALKRINDKEAFLKRRYENEIYSMELGGKNLSFAK